jgi:hypothetical protein
MRTIEGPGVYLAQFAADTSPHNSQPGIARWAAMPSDVHRPE